MAYITHIHIENCRNVRQLDIDLTASTPEGEEPASSERPRTVFRHLILTGPNGSGKSGVLKAIARELTAELVPGDVLDNLGLRGLIDPTRWRPFSWQTYVAVAEHTGLPESELYGDLGEISLLWSTSPTDLLDLYVRGELLAVYMSPRRLLRRQGTSGPQAFLLEKQELRPANELASRLQQFLVNKHTEMAYARADGDTATAERIEAWFARLWDRIRALMEDPGLTIRYDRKTFTFRFKRSDDGYEFDLNTLADGHAAVFALVAEISIRVEEARRKHGDFSFEPEGVVVVDEIETHLHLSLQEQILPLLTDMFPRLQFIVATHSPAVIASIPGAVVYDLRKKVQARSDDYRGIPYGVLMTEHFGISSDIDLDSTRKLLRFRELAAAPTRTPEQEREMNDLAAELSARSQVLATEVWMVQERLRASHVQLAGE